MFNKEELESWNEIFINGKIQETDIKRPTESFLVRALVAYLQVFGYKVEIPVENENPREKRLFLVRLAANIDRVLKVTDKSNAFYYYDLVQPVPKKTSKVLGILLNYYFFYKMVKNDVFSMSNELIKAHEELLNGIKATQREIQERTERLEKIEEEIRSFSKTVPTLKAQLDAWNKKKVTQEEQLQKENEEIEILNKKLLDLRAEEKNLKTQIVEDNEAIKLKSELTNVQKNIEERLSMKENLESELTERMKVIQELENLLLRLKEAKNIFPSTLLDEYKDISKKLKQSKLQYDSLSHKNASLREVIEKQDIELQTMEEELKKKRQQFEQEKANKLTTIKEKQALRTAKQQEVELLKDKLEKDSYELEDQRRTRAFLEKSIQKLLAHYINGKKQSEFR